MATRRLRVPKVTLPHVRLPKAKGLKKVAGAVVNGVQNAAGNMRYDVRDAVGKVRDKASNINYKVMPSFEIPLVGSFRDKEKSVHNKNGKRVKSGEYYRRLNLLGLGIVTSERALIQINGETVAGYKKKTRLHHVKGLKFERETVVEKMEDAAFDLHAFFEQNKKDSFEKKFANNHQKRNKALPQAAAMLRAVALDQSFEDAVSDPDFSQKEDPMFRKHGRPDLSNVTEISHQSVGGFMDYTMQCVDFSMGYMEYDKNDGFNNGLAANFTSHLKDTGIGVLAYAANPVGTLLMGSVMANNLLRHRLRNSYAQKRRMKKLTRQKAEMADLAEKYEKALAPGYQGTDSASDIQSKLLGVAMKSTRTMEFGAKATRNITRVSALSSIAMGGLAAAATIAMIVATGGAGLGLLGLLGAYTGGKAAYLGIFKNGIGALMEGKDRYKQEMSTINQMRDNIWEMTGSALRAPNVVSMQQWSGKIAHGHAA